MKYQNCIVPLTFVFATVLGAVANDDYSVGAAVISSDGTTAGHDKSKSKLGVKQLEDEDNHPTPDHLKKPLDPYQSSGTVGEDAPGPQNYDAFIMSVSMIVVSEIGDKTFLIAALMAMRNSRVIVFTAAFTSLVVMTVLSGIVGHALPTLISQRVTQFLAAILFVIFGAKLLREGLSMSKDLGVEEELAEVEEEIASSKINSQLNDIEGGTGPSNNNSNQPWLSNIGQQLQNLASFIFTPVWIQVFVMTFLGEWGDRSQIATIAMAAGSEYWYVILGAIIGHGLCTAAACLGGKLLAKKISMRNVTLGGAIAFFVFSILYFYDAYYHVEG
ncbi:GDT1 [Candida theae]|uniref:GDT1 family protein n=1 Tax=Candida theae TaxID=1198502 RepID=A0AAD5BF43_9ASCO|nr:GDT1 [Candida theae]KAI5958270.1 GDT1 [Candida theae]